MAGPFSLGPNDDPTANLPDEGTFNKLRDQWTTFMDDPGGRAALLSMGLSLMQPPNFGDNPTSQIGRALGMAGETVGRREAMDVKQRETGVKEQEAESRQQLRASQADAATSRADTAAARLGTQAGNLQLQRERLDATERQRTLQQRIKLSADYGRLRGAIEARNEVKRKNWNNNKSLDPKLAEPAYEPIPSPEEYFSRAEQALGGSPTPARTPAPTLLQSPGQSGIPQISTQEEYDGLQPGQQYIDPKGVTRTKS